MKKQYAFLLPAILGAGLLATCGDDSTSDNHEGMDHTNTAEESSGEMDHSEMGHEQHGSGEIPEGLAEASDPAFPVGSEATIKEGHMSGMEGAVATIVGAYDTTAYIISYEPTTGGEPVKNHKWIIQEEIKDAQSEPYKPGDEVTTTADHMQGIKNASVTIEQAEQTTVYMIDYTDTDSGESITNHKWVTEEELEN